MSLYLLYFLAGTPWVLICTLFMKRDETFACTRQRLEQRMAHHVRGIKIVAGIVCLLLAVPTMAALWVTRDFVILAYCAGCFITGAIVQHHIFAWSRHHTALHGAVCLQQPHKH